MIKRRTLALLALCLASAGCFDFVEPDFPEAGAPAVLQASASVNERGKVFIDALLVPGLAVGGVQRNVLRDTLDVYGLKLAPTRIRRNGSREYHFEGSLPNADPLAQPFQVSAPRVEDIVGPPPEVRWFGIRKVDADTIAWTRGTDLLLRTQVIPGTPLPPPAIRQWFLELRGADTSFRISSDGLPPAVLRVPSEWVPATDTGELTVSLVFYQAGTQHSPTRDYIGNVTFTVQLVWVVRVNLS